jgi:type II secretory pathway pseudopilin PulG
MRFKTHTTKGITAIEVVIGVSIAALVLTFATHSLVRFINTGRSVTEKTQALYLAEEGLELIRFVRDSAWSNISGLPLNSARHLSITSGAITITTTPEYIETFRRSFTVQNVYRNNSDDIVASTTSGAVADDKAKYVTVSIDFGTPTTTVSLTTILTELDP